MEVVMSYRQKYVFQKNPKDINVKVFNMIVNKKETKTIKNLMSCDCKWKFNSTTCNSNKKLNNETCQCECKNYHACKKGYFWKPSTCICENNKYLISIVDTSLIKCDEIVSVVDIVSTKITNVVATNVSINSDDRKGRYKNDCYILHSFISDHITFDNYYY